MTKRHSRASGPWLGLAVGVGLLVAAQALAWWLWPRRPAMAGVPAVAVAAASVDVGEAAGEFAGTLILGGMRGLVVDLLWLRAMEARDERRFYESVAVYQMIGRIQPRYIEAWRSMGHELAYNIANEAGDRAERWHWFVAGADALTEGIARNPTSHRLLTSLAWTIFHRGQQFPDQIRWHDWQPLLTLLSERFPALMAARPRATVASAAVLGDGGATGGTTDMRTQALSGSGGEVRLTGLQGTWQVGQAVRLAGLEPAVSTVAGQDPSVDASLADQADQADGAAELTAASGAGVVLAIDDAGALVRWSGPLPAVGSGVGSGLSQGNLSALVYTLAIDLAEQMGDAALGSARRLAVLGLARDGHDLARTGHHRAALARWLDALAGWDAVAAWQAAVADDHLNPTQQAFGEMAVVRNRGRLQRLVERAGVALAADAATAAAWRAALVGDDLVAARQLLVTGAWRPQPPQSSAVDWLDQAWAAASGQE